MRVRQTERLYKIGFSQIIIDFDVVDQVMAFNVNRHKLKENEFFTSMASSTVERNVPKLDFFEVSSYDDLLAVSFSGNEGGAYFYDQENNEVFFINRYSSVADSFDNIALSRFVRATKQVFYSDFKDLTAHVNPISETGPLRLYENRVLSRPEIERDFSDSFFGVLSISTNKVTLNNRDAQINKFFQSGFSFYDQAVQIFRRDNFDQSFTLEAVNTIRNFMANKKSASLELVDFNYSFESPYTSLPNDTAEAQKWLRWIELKPTGSIHPNFRDLDLIESIGTTPTSIYVNNTSSGDAITTLNAVPSDAMVTLAESLIQACNVDDVGATSTENNRKWAVGISDAGTFSGAVYDDCAVDGINIEVDLTNGFNTDLPERILPGEWCFVGPIAGTLKATRLNRIENDIAYFTRIDDDIATGNTALSFDFVSVPVVYIEVDKTDGDGVVTRERFEVSPANYAISDEDLGLSNGKVFKVITFTDGFEIAIGVPFFLKPDQTILAKIRPPNSSKTVIGTISQILNSSGVPVNSTSFSEASSLFNPKIAIKYNHDMTKQEILELCLESIFGYLSLNNLGEFELFFHAVKGENKSINKSNISIFSESIDASYDETFNALKVVHINNNGLSRGIDMEPRADSPFAQLLEGRISVKEVRTCIDPAYDLSVILEGVSSSNSVHLFTFDMRMALRFLRNICSGFYNYESTVNEGDGLVEIADSLNSDFLRNGDSQDVEVTYVKDQTLRKSIAGYRINRENFDQVIYLTDETGASASYQDLKKQSEE